MRKKNRTYAFAYGLRSVIVLYVKLMPLLSSNPWLLSAVAGSWVDFFGNSSGGQLLDAPSLSFGHDNCASLPWVPPARATCPKTPRLSVLESGPDGWLIKEML